MLGRFFAFLCYNRGMSIVTEFNLNTTVHGVKFAFGAFLNTFVSLIVLAAAAFFLIAKPLKATRCAFYHAEVAAS